MFLQLLVTQLRYQDPMRAGGEREFVGQLAQFALVEQMTEISRWSRLAAGARLIGTEVTATNRDGKPLTGVVSGVRMEADGPVLLIAGVSVPLSQVKEARIPGPR
jgi:flagellar basal-body rod modification protein FlgD